MSKQSIVLLKSLVAAAAVCASTAPASAQIALSQTVVDFQPNRPSYEDIEVLNSGSERAYVLAEPSQILAPGTASERRVNNPDPAALGLLVTPQRLVLEPGQRRIIRISAIAQRDSTERVYRVAIKPVAGEINAPTSALKVLIGYDVLVLFRPVTVMGEISATRAGKFLDFDNKSNIAQEIYTGRQCDQSGAKCLDLPAKRLYPSAKWHVDLPYDAPVEYSIKDENRSVVKRF